MSVYRDYATPTTLLMHRRERERERERERDTPFISAEEHKELGMEIRCDQATGL